MQLPKDGLASYFNTNTSSLNPHNFHYDFYVYGTFPIVFTKYLAVFSDNDNYDSIALLGRRISLILDVVSCLLIFLIVKRISNSWKAATLSMLFYTAMPSVIQQARFYTTDVWQNTFAILAFYLLLVLDKKTNDKNSQSAKTPKLWKRWLLLGLFALSLGLSVANKISGVVFAGFILAAFTFKNLFWEVKWTGRNFNPTNMLKKIAEVLVICLIFLVSLRIFQPYLFAGPGFLNFDLNQKVIANWQQLKNWEKPGQVPPFGLQWVPTKVLIYPAIHLFFWGIGIPMSLLFISCSMIYVRNFFQDKSKKLWLKIQQNYLLILCWSWVVVGFVYNGIQFAKALRYFYFLMPFIAIFSAIILDQLLEKAKKPFKLLLIGWLLTILWWSFGFLSIYYHPHSRIQASNWIYDNVPTHARLGIETWDDGLPLNVRRHNISPYLNSELSPYDSDTLQKWEKMANTISQLDYILLTSNRVWRPISALPETYPYTTRYYQKLATGELGFEIVANFSQYPCLLPKTEFFETKSYFNDPQQDFDPTPPIIDLGSNPQCALQLINDGGDETFTVYDHPRVIILQNTQHYPAEKLFKLITNQELHRSVGDKQIPKK